MKLIPGMQSIPIICCIQPQTWWVKSMFKAILLALVTWTMPMNTNTILWPTKNTKLAFTWPMSYSLQACIETKFLSWRAWSKRSSVPLRFTRCFSRKDGHSTLLKNVLLLIIMMLFTLGCPLIKIKYIVLFNNKFLCHPSSLDDSSYVCPTQKPKWSFDNFLQLDSKSDIQLNSLSQWFSISDQF